MYKTIKSETCNRKTPLHHIDGHMFDYMQRMHKKLQQNIIKTKSRMLYISGFTRKPYGWTEVSLTICIGTHNNMYVAYHTNSKERIKKTHSKR